VPPTTVAVTLPFPTTSRGRLNVVTPFHHLSGHLHRSLGAGPITTSNEDERQFGALLEAGACLGNGGQLYLVSPHDWPFLCHHPRCRSFKTLADAVSAIMT
jgi:hypothetical protein